MSTIRITEISKSANRIEITIDIPMEYKKYFLSEKFYCEYSESIENVPDSVAVIPLLSQILPISWVVNANIEIDEIDKNFLESIPNFKNGYKKMYPRMQFNGKLTYSNTKPNDTYTKLKKSETGVFFSGGVDAFSTLVAHYEEHPVLISIWGADIRTWDTIGWQNALLHNQKTASQFNLPLIQIKSNFSEFLNQIELNNIVQKISGDNWWHGFQHGLGLIGLSAPTAYVRNLKTIYIASSYTPKDNVTCASHPDIDGNIKYCQTQIVHDQYDHNRVQKTIGICDFSKNNNVYPFLRVCYRDDAGENCCQCEKCIRTACTIFLLGQDLTRYGFLDSKHMFKHSRLKVLSQLSPTAVPLWNDIQELANRPETTINHQLRWILDCDFEKERKTIYIRAFNYAKRKSRLFRRFCKLL